MLWNSDKPDKEKIKILVSAGFEAVKRDQDLTMTVLSLCKKIFGLGPATCEKELYRYYNQLINLKTRKVSRAKENLYVLKPGRSLYRGGVHVHQNPAGDPKTWLTDSLAEKMIAESPGLVNNFASIPTAESKEAAKKAKVAEKKQRADDKKKADADAAEKLRLENEAKQKGMDGPDEGSLEWYQAKLNELGISYAHNAGLENLKKKLESAQK